MSHVLVIDNYDSFTYNVVQALLTVGAEVTVCTNDSVTVEEALRLEPTHLVLSPGPGRPEDAGITLEAIGTFAGTVPILGICLGHQAIGMAYGGSVVPARHLVHGKASPVIHDGATIFRGLPNPFPAGRYHSLAVRGLGPEVHVSAQTPDGEVMAIRHRRLPIEGVQFHPESLLTPDGDVLLANFLATAPVVAVPNREVASC